MSWYMCTLWKDSAHSVNEHIWYLTFLSFLVKKFKFYSPSKFQLYNTVFSTIITLFYIRSSDFISSYSCKFVPASLNSLVPEWGTIGPGGTSQSRPQDTKWLGYGYEIT